MVTFGGKLTKKYLKICIHILGSGKLERAFRAFDAGAIPSARPLGTAAAANKT